MTQAEIQGFRLSPRQRRLWSLGAGELAVRCLLELTGEIDLPRLHAAARRVVERHEILRTVFRAIPGIRFPVQVVLEEPRFGWRQGSPEELSPGWPGGGPFDLAAGPPARFVLARTAPGRALLAVELPALCADARTLANLAAELATLAAGGTPEDAEPVQYADVCDWLAELDAEEGREAREFWRARGWAAAPAGPSARAAEGAPEAAARLPWSWELPAAVAQSMDEIARRAGVPAEMVYLAAWQTLLARLFPGRDPLVGLVRDGRRFRQFRTAFGPFATAVPAPSPGDGRMRLGELAHALRDFADESRARVELFPAEELGAAGFPALFEMEEWPAELRAGGLRLALAARSGRGEPAGLKLHLVRRGATLTAELAAGPGIDEAERPERLAASFAAFLADASRRPEAPLAELAVLGPEERRQLLADWGAGAREAWPDRCLHELVAERAAATPEAPAAGCDGSEISFAELELRARRLASRLRRLGVGPEVRVALCAERSLESLVGVLAVWKAGGAYVPLDPRQPASRLAFQLADCGAPVVLAQASLLPHLPLGGAHAVPLDGDLAAESDTAFASGAGPDNLAYVIYTSGSTGRPKGVMIRHGALAHLARALRRAVYAGIAGDGPLRVAVNAPLAFDASVKQLVQWAHGHSLHVIPEGVRADGEALLAHLRRHRLDVLDVTPAQLRLLVEAGLTAPGGEHPRLVLVGGEAVDGPLWESLSTAGTPVFQNVYGPSECTVDATSRRITAGVAPALGRPIPNVSIRVLDARGEPAPIGVPGELTIGGAGVGRGYLGRPALTAERFVPDPFGAGPGERGARLYRSGDLARWRPDGELEFLGRGDDQVKIRGFRVELGEIEATLSRHPGIAAAVVTARAGGSAGDLRLAGYAVPRRAAVDLGGRPRFRLPNGLSVVQQNRNETEYLYHEIFAQRSYLRHGLRLPAAARVFDVGANIGLFTLFAGLASPAARVWACEPIAPLCEAARLNAALYGIDARPLQIGLAAAAGAARFSYYPRYSMLSGLSDYADPAGDARAIKDFLRHEEGGELLANVDELLAGRFQPEIHDCRLRRLSEVIREEKIDRIDLLKIDVQRAEIDVLQGIDREHWEVIDQLVVEVHDEPGGPTAGRLGEVRDLLVGHGYEVLTDQDERLAGTDRHTVYAARGNGGVPRLVFGLEPPPSPPVPGELEEVTPALLRDYLRTRLPEPMVPVDVVLLPALPLTRNGKVDRAALPDPRTLVAAAAAAEGPRGLVEEILAAVWSSLLRTERVAPGDDFFQLGGHSLLVTRLVSRIRHTFGVELPIPAIFEAPTLRGLAARIQSAAGAALPLPPVTPGPAEAAAPLSFPQRRLWLIDRLEPATPLYNNPFAIRFTGDLRPAVLAAALAEVVRRHAVLRTLFAPGEDEASEPVQAVQRWRPDAVPLPVIDLHGLAADRAAAEAERLRAREARIPFDLARGPLLRACLLRTGAAEHTALLTLHHIVCDGWSLSLLAHELGSLYGAGAAGRPSPLPELPVQYADYARWQRRWLTGEALTERLAAWRSRLAGLAPELPLPTDRPRRPAPVMPSHRGARRRFHLEAGAVARLREVGRDAGATLFMTLLAALQLLLARHAGVDDVAVGSPVAGRDRLETEGLVGFFVNTLVLRGHPAGASAFTAYLAQVRETVLFAHQNEVPFEILVDTLSPERRLGRSPLFRVLFVLRNEPREALRLPGLAAVPLEADPGIARLDLTVLAEETADGLAGFWEHALDLFDPATVDRLAGRWRVLLGGIAADPHRPLAELPLLDPAELEELRASQGRPGDWDLTAATVPRLLAAVAVHPEAPAVVHHDTVLSYRELFSSVGALAARLRELGVGLETAVAICLPRSPAMVIAVLAVLETGGAYVPFDPAYPAERMDLLIEEARPAVLVAGSPLPAGLAASGAPVVRLEIGSVLPGREGPAGGDLPRAAGAAPPAGGPLPESAAYRLYTSGSTGRPKGVVVSHRGLCNLIEAQRRSFAVRPGDRVLQFAPLGFDASIAEILVTLGAGATLVLADREELLPGPGLAGLLRDAAITHVTLPPSVLALLPEDELPALTTLIAAGEACPSELAARWASADRRVLNAYGPTEATVCATIDEEHSGDGPLTIGRPMAGARVYVLDAALGPVPPGAPGELCIGGAGVARGYAGRPDLTAERFVPDASGLPGSRLYRTGDLARLRPDGRLDFLGRIDRQVKVRGVRIEPGEVEAALRRHPWVRDAAVAARGAAEGDRRLVAWVAPHPDLPGEDLSSALLRTWLRGILPEALIPSVVLPVAALPLTAHGKLDLAALPDPGAVRAEGGAGAPRTPVEEVLAGIWEEVLGLERAGVDDDFFALGGHSLLATRVTARLHAAFGVDLPLRALFEAPTVAALARRVEAAVGAGTLPEAPPLRRAPRAGDTPLSFAQQRLWFLDQLDPGSPRYNLPAAVRLDGVLDAGALAGLGRRLSGIVRRHEALRTCFPAVDGRPRQEIATAAPVPLPVIDLSALPTPAGEGELRRLAAEDAVRPFDLARGPVLRAAFVRLAAEAGAVLFALHHIASDGRSLEIFLEELADPAIAAPLPVQYADYAAWQRGWLRGEALEARLRFWRRQLAGAPPLLDLPTDRPRPAGAAASPFASGLHRQLRPGVSAPALRAVARRHGATPFLVALAAFQAFLGRVTSQDDFCLGTVTAGRDRVETERLIGLFVNTLVLRADLGGDPTGGEILARARSATLAAHQHGDLPFEKLVDELRPGRDWRHNPLFQALFGFQRAPASPARIDGLAVQPLAMELTGATAKLDLVLSLVESGDGVTGRLELDRDLFDGATADRLAAGFERLFAGLVERPEVPLSELPLLAPAEIAQLLDWGRGPVPAALEAQTVPALFARRAAERPMAPAVLCGDEVLTFGELDRRSGGLARALRDAGVGPEARVALCVERSLDLAVGVLGILRAGGALVPLDPAQPTARLAWMLADCGACVVVTQEGLAPLLPAQPPRLILSEVDPAEEEAWSVQPAAESLAYLIYTSGTTGRPKAVLAGHGGLAHLLAVVRSEFGFAPGDRMPCLAPATFDIFFFELLGPLLAGGSVALLPMRPALDLDLLAREIAEATHLHAVPALMRQVVDETRRRGTAAPRLRGLFVGGDAVPAALLADLRSTFPQAWIRVLYGPTEGTILASSHAVEAAAAAAPPAGGRTWLGRPLPGLELRVCDRRGVLVPPGSPGELQIGGPGVARGYHGRPDLTALRWTPADGGRRFYRTGDLVRWRDDGALEFLGRADDQVKIRGVRIEPGEVEAALLRHPGVAAAAVAARPGPGGADGEDRRLVAWIVPRESAQLAPAELRAFLAENLAEALIPSVFVTLPALPLTVHGKVDRAALPAPGRERSGLAAAAVPPRSAAEVVLTRIWAEVLGLEQVGVHDNFFTLGGDSILSIQIVARAYQAGLRLAPRQVFQHQTVAELAAVADVVTSSADGGYEPAGGPVPLTPIQRRFFAGEPIDPHHFNQALLLEVDAAAGEWLRPWLSRAVAALLSHHGALRLRFRHDPAGWSQEISPPGGSPPFTVIDLSVLPPALRTAALASSAAALQGGFDLASGALLRAALLILGSDGKGDAALRLWIGAHHLAVDAVSWRILLEDLRTAGEQLARGETVRLPARTTSFQHWAGRLAELARSGERRRELAAWLAPLRDPAARVSPDRPAGRVGEGRTLDSGLDAETTQTLLHAAPAALRSQVPEILLTALAMALRRSIPAGALVVDVEGHGREEVFPDVDLSRTVGWFTTIHPVALDPGPGGDPAVALARVKEQLRGVPERGFGYGVLRFLDAGSEELLRDLPAAAVAFNYLGRVDAGAAGPFRLAPEGAGPARSPRAQREHPLGLGAWVADDRLRLDWSYHPAALTPPAVAALAADFLAALRRLLALASEPRTVAPAASDFPLLSLGGADLAALLSEVDFEGPGG